MLSTLLGIGTEIGSSNDENEIAKAIRESAQHTAADVGQKIVFPVRIIVNRDILMQTYGASKEPT